MAIDNLQDHILTQLAGRMQSSIDHEVLSDVLTRFGWTAVSISYHSSRTWQAAIEWADQNCEGEFKEHMGHWIFENPADATAFTLRWL
jgi:transketolase N-terminal domain/subunit